MARSAWGADLSRFRRSHRGVAGSYLLAVIVVLIGLGLGALGNVLSTSWPQLAIIGPIIVGLGVGIGMLGGGVVNPAAYVIVIPGVILLLIAINVWNLWGLHSIGLTTIAPTVGP